VPTGLTGVVAIAAGSYHSLALKSDGSVVAWGNDLDGQTDVPPGLGDVTAIAAGYLLSMAVRADGTVVVWGNLDQPRPPPAGLDNVVAVAAGDFHCLALRADGTLVAWGFDSDGQASIPSGLGGVTAIAAGGYHSLALRNVLTPEMAIRQLRDDVNRLQGITIRNALQVKLNAALAAPSGSRACQWLQAFINQARAQRGKLLGIAQADYLIAQARDIRLLLGCR
jgi:hypothetical protein